MERVVVFALPIFIVLMGAEIAYGYFRNRNTYRLCDSLGSLSQGLVSQLMATITQIFQIGIYAIAYNTLALLPHAAIWQNWYGWLIAVVLFDFCDYWLHRMGHECALMWAAHAVHHQSQHFNFSTALRQESMVVFLGWPFYLPMALIGVPPEQFALAGFIVLFYQFWIHTEHIGKLGWFDRIFSSPSNHRVHHAVNDPYLDKNYGGMLIVWDRMFGTFEEEMEPCVYGTRTPLKSLDPIWAIFSGYWDIFQLARQARYWPHKLLFFIKHPGWLPDDLKATQSAPDFDLKEAGLIYEPALSRATRNFAIAQFCILVMAGALYLWFGDELSYSQSIITTAMLVGGIWSLGALMQDRFSPKHVLLVDMLGIVVALCMF